MYCRHCGKEIDDEAIVCIHCGVQVQGAVRNSVAYNSEEYDVPKTGMGVLFSLLLGLIGLLIGILLYPSNTIARKTFIKGWVITFAICCAVAIFFLLLLVFVVIAMI